MSDFPEIKRCTLLKDENIKYATAGDDIREYLELSYSGAKMMGDEEAMLRISRALAAFDAPTDIDIFVKYNAEI